MGANTFGTCFQITTFGESHGSAMGVVVEGCPAGVPFSWSLIQEKMNRRRPGYFPWMSARKEPDEPELLSGVFEDRTLGTPLALLVRNKNFQSEDYRTIKDNPRPGHADDVWKKKFGHLDYRGGGRASGRETTGRVLGGAVAEMFLKEQYHHLNITAVPVQIGSFVREDFDTPSGGELWFGKQTKEVEEFLVQKKSEGLSYGGAIEMKIDNPPAGLGQPVFRKLKSDLASAFMGIGACYEVSLGGRRPGISSGEQDVPVRFENSDSYRREKAEKLKPDQYKTGPGKQDISLEEGSQLHGKKNAWVYGGIRGGISTGEKIVFRLKFKPPASVLEIAKKGRHDPCIVPRVAVVVEAMAWLVTADHVLWSRQDCLS